MSTKKILIFIAYFSIIVPNLFGMQSQRTAASDELLRTLFSGNSSLRNSPEGRNLDKMQMHIGAMEGISQKITSLNEKLKNLNEIAESLKGKGSENEIAQNNALIAKTQKDLSSYTNFLGRFQVLNDIFLKNVTNDSTERKTGIFLAKLFAGPDKANNISEDEISGIWSGLAQGLAVPAGEVMKDKAKATISTTVGGLWDFIFAKLGDFTSMVRNVLFHDNNEPFDHQKVDGWQKMIMAAYDDIDNMLRNGLRDAGRSLDSVSRQFDDNNSEIQVKKEIDMWASLAEGYAEQFAYFITLFESRQEYYDEDDIVVFYSNQICKMLQTTCKLLVNSKSLKDLDAKIESQKTIIPAIKKNLWNLFEQLKSEVKPKSSSIKDSTASSSSTYKSNSYNAYSGNNGYGYNNDGPTPFSGF